MTAEHFPISFLLLAQLSHDSNIFREFVTDGERIHDVEFVLVNSLPFAVAAPVDHLASQRSPPTPLSSSAEVLSPGS